MKEQRETPWNVSTKIDPQSSQLTIGESITYGHLLFGIFECNLLK